MSPTPSLMQRARERKKRTDSRALIRIITWYIQYVAAAGVLISKGFLFFVFFLFLDKTRSKEKPAIICWPFKLSLPHPSIHPSIHPTNNNNNKNAETTYFTYYSTVISREVTTTAQRRLVIQSHKKKLRKALTRSHAPIHTCIVYCV